MYHGKPLVLYNLGTLKYFAKTNNFRGILNEKTIGRSCGE